MYYYCSFVTVSMYFDLVNKGYVSYASNSPQTHTHNVNNVFGIHLVTISEAGYFSTSQNEFTTSSTFPL